MRKVLLTTGSLLILVSWVLPSGVGAPVFGPGSRCVRGGTFVDEFGNRKWRFLVGWHHADQAPEKHESPALTGLRAGHGSPLNYYVPGLCVCLGGLTLPTTGTGRRPRGPARCHGWNLEGFLGRVGDPPCT
jgi:hypothetical protein